METPYAQIQWKALAAPLEEMEEVVISTLNAMGFSRFNYSEHPKCVYATKCDTEHWRRPFNREYAVEVQWKEDVNPPAEYANLSLGSAFLNPLLVRIRLKRENSQNQSNAVRCLPQLWNELKQRALDASEALANKKPPTDHGAARWATLADLKAEDYLREHTTEDLSSRLILGYLQDKLVTVPKRLTEAHAIVMGPPGAGHVTPESMSEPADALP